MDNQPIFAPSDFVAVLNQTLEYAYPSVMIQGELANLRISKNRWAYFDLKDEHSSVKFFGTVNQLPGPLQDGLLVQVRGLPRLHNLYGFSVNVQFIKPVGEGSIRKAAELLQAQLAAEGLFAPERKRPLPYPPRKIGLITSEESAAYRDFIKVLGARWGGVEIVLVNVQVQGESAVGQLVAALEAFNQYGDDIDALVLTRGGGSPEDLAAFSHEPVVRAVAASRIPTLVAIGHEVDISLAELAADRRASTPSNAAELLVPDRRHQLEILQANRLQMGQSLSSKLLDHKAGLQRSADSLKQLAGQLLTGLKRENQLRAEILQALSPRAALRRGYALIRQDGKLLRSVKPVKPGSLVVIELHDGSLSAKVEPGL